MLPYLDNLDEFPSPLQALDDPNGLLAVGANLRVDTLIRAYSNGIFPWYGEDEPILWWSPDPRGVLFLDEYKPSKSLIKFARRSQYHLSKNRAFEQVIMECATVPRNESGTWINPNMVAAYIALHRAGFAHSIEVWRDNTLVGGLYGVAIGQVFCGESMFHRETNCSKLAFVALNQLLSNNGYQMIDCQMQNSHLKSMGVKEMSRIDFLSHLEIYKDKAVDTQCWQPDLISLSAQS